MAFFRDFPGRIWNFVSPRKTQQKREKEFKVPVATLPAAVAQKKKMLATPKARSTSPESRVKTWATRTPAPNSDVDLDETLLPPSPPASSLPVGDDLEGDTLLPESPTTQISDNTGSSADEWDANEDTMVVDDDQYLNSKINVQEERKRRDKQGRELRDAGWSEDAVFLFQKLGMRGLEPLLPIEWLNDLETLPEDLFTANVDKAFLKPAYGSGYNAQLALSNLFDLGGRARDARFTKASKRTPAYHIRRAVEKYTTWAMKDGEVDEDWSELPLFKTVTWPANVHSSVGERQMIEKLSFLHEQWSDALATQESEENHVPLEVPTLYGITASHTVMAFVSYAPPTEENETPQLRLIAMFDFGKEGYDVWNSLAIAIFVTHCRNRMMQLQEYLPEMAIFSETDPDA